MKLAFKKVIRESTFCKVRKLIVGYHPQARFEGRYYVVLKDGRIAGCVSLVKRAWYLTELKHLFVKEEERGSGIGKFLVEEALKKVKTPLACCTAMSANVKSIDLFLGRSFEIGSSFQNSMTGHKILFMVKKMDG
jgi:N-acetylglutamate synthase-like GNAT family acetyltransferase